MNPKSTKEKEDRSDFMLNEYERIHGLILEEKRESEQRVNYFLTITSAIGGALIIFFQASTFATNIKFTAAEAILTILFLYGLITLNRLNSRIVQLRAFRKLQDGIREYFANRDPAIAAYIEFHQKALPANPASSVTRLLRGTLQELMITANATICGAIVLVVLLARGSSLQEAVKGTILAFISAIISLAIYHYIIIKRLQPLA